MLRRFLVIWVCIQRTWTPTNSKDAQDIRLPPSITAQPKQQIFYKLGADIELPCQAEGHPSPSYTWLKNGSVLDVESLPNVQRKAADTGTLVISPDVSSDAQEYQCIVENVHGKAESDTVTLTQAVIGANTPAASPLPITATKGQPLQIACSGLGNFTPPPIYHWKFRPTGAGYEQYVPTTQRMKVTSHDGQLYISDTMESDAGSYTCHGYNKYVNQAQTGDTISLNVSYKYPSIRRPSVAYSSARKTTAWLGQFHVLQCIFSGYPTPEVSWETPDSRQIEQDDNKYFLDMYNSRLTIKNVTVDDEGTYACIGRNTAVAVVARTLMVTVKEALSFTNTSLAPHDLNVTAGETVLVYCRPSRTDPPQTIKWYINGRHMEKTKNNTADHHVLLSEKLSIGFDTLMIRDVCKDCGDGTSDLMVIKCEASNAENTASAQGYINVLDPTAIMASSSPDIMWGANGEARMACNGTSDPSTPETYSWYLGGKPINISKPYMEIEGNTLTVQVGSLQANGTESGYYGNYTCIVSNGYSSDSVSFLLEKPVKKRGNYKILLGIFGATLFVIVLLVDLKLLLWARKN